MAVADKATVELDGVVVEEGWNMPNEEVGEAAAAKEAQWKVSRGFEGLSVDGGRTSNSHVLRPTVVERSVWQNMVYDRDASVRSASSRFVDEKVKEIGRRG